MQGGAGRHRPSELPVGSAERAHRPDELYRGSRPALPPASLFSHFPTATTQRRRRGPNTKQTDVFEARTKAARSIGALRAAHEGVLQNPRGEHLPVVLCRRQDRAHDLAATDHLGAGLAAELRR